LADAIKDKFGVECEMIKGGGGVFDVTADGKIVYSKRETGRFPEHGEVLDALAPLAG
jgi:selenoprotein W-related protein